MKIKGQLYWKVYELSRLSWMRESAYVTYLKYESEYENKPTKIGWKIKSFKSDTLCLVGFPDTWERSEICIDLTQPFEFNTSKGTDKDGCEHIIRDWINPQTKIGELVQVWENELHPIEKEEIVTVKIGGYERTCMVVHWVYSGFHRVTYHKCYDKKTGILLDNSEQIYRGDIEKYSTRSEQINSTNIPELLGNTTPKKCPICGKSVPENFKFCGNCGALVDEKRCPKCGEVIPENFTFCGHCGTKIDGDETKVY